MLGVIRVLTSSKRSEAMAHGRLMEEATGISTVTRCIADQPHGIFDDVSERFAVPKIVELARDFESDGRVDAITISCAADPAVNEVREAVSLPVIGAGACGAYAARMLSDSVAVLGISDTVPDRMRAALGSSFHSVRYHPDIRRATDLSEAGAHRALLDCAHQAESEGATALLFACTGFSTIHLKSYFDRRLTIPSIDLIQAQAIAYSNRTTEGWPCLSR